jgi:hypothetical protein
LNRSDLTQELTMLETWRWCGDDWYFVQADRPEEFEEHHSELQGALRR